jgi:hypothetical protein
VLEVKPVKCHFKPLEFVIDIRASKDLNSCQKPQAWIPIIIIIKGDLCFFHMEQNQIMYLAIADAMVGIVERLLHGDVYRVECLKIYVRA